MAHRTALLTGATGLVGRHCLHHLLRHPGYDRVVVLSRRPLEVSDPRLHSVVCDFDRLSEAALPGDVDDLYTCLGTTRKAAGSAQAFRHVDHDYTAAALRLAREHGADRLALVSSLGADPRSRTFYLRVKGETEHAAVQAGFASTHLFRPSFLLGQRGETRRRERASIAAARAVTPLLRGPMHAWRPVPASELAAAMVAAVVRGDPGVHRHVYADIQHFAARVP